MALRRFPISGELDLATAPALQAKLDVLVALTDDDLVLDCEGLVFIDSTGVRLFIHTRNALQAAGRRCTVENLTERCRRPFEILGLTERLELRELDLA